MILALEPDELQLIGTGLALLAAGASWASVYQTRRAAKRAALPLLHGEGRQVPYTVPTSRLQLAVHNSGRGIGKAPMAIVVRNGEYAAGTLTDGFIEPDETVRVLCNLEWSVDSEPPRIEGVLVCRDVDQSSWVWHLRTGRRKRLRRNSRWNRLRRAPYNEDQQMIAAFYPDVKLAELTPVSFMIPKS